MKASDYLRAEHRRIEGMLVALSAAAVEIQTAGTAPAYTADLLELLVDFIDIGHHAKEEAFLFPALARHGVAQEGVVDAMAHQHQIGRIHVRDMRRALPGVQAGDAAARETFVTSAQAYVELLRVHIQIEDDDLYPMVDRLFAADEDRRLVDEFLAIDASTDGAGRLARCEALLGRMPAPARH